MWPAGANIYIEWFTVAYADAVLARLLRTDISLLQMLMLCWHANAN